MMNKQAARFCGLIIVAFFCFLIPSHSFATEDIFEETININKATSDELELLEGVDHILAEKIILAREAGGFFQSFADLEARVEGLENKLTSQWSNAVVKIPAPFEEDNLAELEKELYRTQE